MLWNRCTSCWCDPPTPDCFGCYPENEPYYWELDFSQPSYYGSLTDSCSYFNETGGCPPTGSHQIDDYSMSREYPAVGSLGNTTILNRETTPNCAWGFATALAYGIRTYNANFAPTACGACGPVNDSTLYGGVTVPDQFHSLTFPGSAVQASLDAAKPGDCNTSSRCGGGFASTISVLCGNYFFFGWAGILQYLNGYLTFRLYWRPKFLWRHNYASSADFNYPVYSYAATGAGAALPDPVTSNAWANCYSNVFPRASSIGDLVNYFIEWKKGITCGSLTGSPIVLDLQDASQVATDFDKWGLTGIPTQVTVTPYF